MSNSTNGKTVVRKMRIVIHLSLRDSFPPYRPISDIQFSLAKDGVSLFVTPSLECLTSFSNRTGPEA